MVNGGWEGLLVPISSVNKVGQAGQINYSSTKVADALMPKIIIGEFLMRGIRNIRCVGIAPGICRNQYAHRNESGCTESTARRCASGTFA